MVQDKAGDCRRAVRNRATLETGRQCGRAQWRYAFRMRSPVLFEGVFEVLHDFGPSHAAARPAPNEEAIWT